MYADENPPYIAGTLLAEEDLSVGDRFLQCVSEYEAEEFVTGCKTLAMNRLPELDRDAAARYVRRVIERLKGVLVRNAVYGIRSAVEMDILENFAAIREIYFCVKTLLSVAAGEIRRVDIGGGMYAQRCGSVVRIYTSTALPDWYATKMFVKDAMDERDTADAARILKDKLRSFYEEYGISDVDMRGVYGDAATEDILGVFRGMRMDARVTMVNSVLDTFPYLDTCKSSQAAGRNALALAREMQGSVFSGEAGRSAALFMQELLWMWDTRRYHFSSILLLITIADNREGDSRCRMALDVLLADVLRAVNRRRRGVAARDIELLAELFADNSTAERVFCSTPYKVRQWASRGALCAARAAVECFLLAHDERYSYEEAVEEVRGLHEVSEDDIEELRAELAAERML